MKALVAHLRANRFDAFRAAVESDPAAARSPQVVERFKGEPCFAHLTMKEVVRSRIAELAAKLL